MRRFPVDWNRSVRALAGLLAACLLLAGCSGSDGSDGRPGPPGPPGPPAGVDIGNAAEIHAEIMSASIASPAEVTFSLTDGNGNPVKNLPATSISFNLAKLVPGTDGNASAWQSYINSIEQPGVGPGTEARVQAVTENGSAGMLTDHDDGTYTYVFGFDIEAVEDPIAVAYEPTLTHRVTFEIRDFAPVRNPVYDFRPSDGATTGLFSREIARTETCNACHSDLSLHGGARFEMGECVACHNPGSADANSGNTVDMTVMTHKIHHGAALPSVLAGGEYCIYGRRDTQHCYDEVVYPQDIRACANCHDAEDPATPDAANWYEVPTEAACGSCHDDVNFATGENHGPDIPADNSQCVSCHANNPNSRIEVRQAHRMLEREAAAAYSYNLLSVTAPGPGAAPVATFSVTNPLDGDAPYDLETDAVLAASALRLSVSWTTDDYSNEGTSRTNSQPENTPVYNGNVLAASPNGDGTYDLALSTVPADQSGSGVVVFEGSVVDPGLGDLGVANAHRYFSITDDPAAPTPRRVSVEMARCNDCHDSLSFHGGRNTDSIESCQTCHNPNAARGGSPSRGPMDVKYFVHRLHAVDDIHYPQPVSQCTACHTDSGFYPNSASSGVLPTSTNRGASVMDPFDNDRITPNTAACSVCHTGDDARIHMEQNGGSLSACLAPDGTLYRKVDECGSGGTLGEVIQESCTVCHGPGRNADVAVQHGL